MLPDADLQSVFKKTQQFKEIRYGGGGIFWSYFWGINRQLYVHGIV